MIISAFGDETATDFGEQLRILTGLDIRHIDIRAAWGVNCSAFNEYHIADIKTLCAKYGVRVACMGSPIGKSPIEEPIEIECERLKTIGATALALGTRNIRLFSFYPRAHDSAALQQSIERLGILTDIAAAHDLQLLLENEKGVVGDLPERCLALMQGVDSPHFRFIWDSSQLRAMRRGAASRCLVGRAAPLHRLHPHQGRAAARGVCGRRRRALASHGGWRGRWASGGIAGELARLGLCGRLVAGAASAGGAAFQRIQRGAGMGMAVAALRDLMAAAGIAETA